MSADKWAENYREDGQYLDLPNLKARVEAKVKKGEENVHFKKAFEYLSKEDIPLYPRPELHVSHVSHSTDLQGLQGIRRDGAFKNPEDSPEPKVLWFSLTISPDELREAESRDMTLVHPGGQGQKIRPTRRPKEEAPDLENMGLEQEGPQEEGPKEEDLEQEGPQEEGPKEEDLEQEGPLEKKAKLEELVLEPGMLQKFATSPSFWSCSRFGSYRFTFSLVDVLDKYSQQFCAGQKADMRVLRTVLYKQKVMYVVLVHSPDSQEMFSEYPLSEYPLLEDTPDSICAFRAEPKPHFIWRPQAMSETHRFGLVVNEGNISTQEFYNRNQQEFYVWDNVALALYVGEEMLKFEDHELRDSLMFCDQDVKVSARPGIKYETFDVAQTKVKKLWPEHNLQKFNKSKFHIFDPEHQPCSD